MACSSVDGASTLSEVQVVGLYQYICAPFPFEDIIYVPDVARTKRGVSSSGVSGARPAVLLSSTVLHIHRAFSKALKQAAADGLIPRNPAAPVKPQQPRGEGIRPLNREQAWALFEAASGDRLEALYIVAVTAGLRRASGTQMG